MNSEDFEAQTKAHLNDLYEEMSRRDQWLIVSIWNLVRVVSSLVIGSIIILFCLLNKYTEWWQLIAAFLVWKIIDLIEFKRLKALEAEDKVKIGNDSLLTSFGSWWR